jgi:Uma2 family endonuclease
MDAAWLSNQRRASKSNDPLYLIAPEICIQVESPANSMEEMMERKRLYFERGAEEFWLCNLNGKVTFYDQSSQAGHKIDATAAVICT